MTREPQTVIRYSISFKQKVVREIEEEGLTLSEASRRYGIKGGQTIQNWLRKFGKNHLISKIVRIEMKGEKDRVKELEAELKRVKLALADATMKNDVLETVIKLASDHYQTDIKKNLGHQPSKTPMPKKDTQ
jgi:transposase-like protein